MLKLFRKRANKKYIFDLENTILKQTSAQFPQLKENTEKWYIYSFNIRPSEILIQYASIDDLVINDNHSAYRIEGLTIENSRNRNTISITVIVINDLIQEIKFGIDINNFEHYPISSIKNKELKATPIVFNAKKNSIQTILEGLPKRQLEKLDIDNSFEIELQGQTFHTIIDMEDGNYIAIDDEGVVYRLIHDHQSPVKKIADSLTKLNYQGNNSMFEKFIE